MHLRVESHQAKEPTTRFGALLLDPKRVQHPQIPLLIGRGGEQATLKLVAYSSDACQLAKIWPKKAGM
jgi:alkanesulfonate monooxygenase SsuD/methylene tetrahydromethanopterin reductase-like flavin-dependent oxidoreductase (luciferase family)